MVTRVLPTIIKIRKNKVHCYVRKIRMDSNLPVPVGSLYWEMLYQLLLKSKKYDFKKFVVVMSIGKTIKAVGIVYFLAIIVSTVFH